MKTTYSLPADYLPMIREICPQATLTDLAGFADLASAGKVIDDKGQPHPALENWVRGIVER